jgi:hypothetical protein
MASLRKLLLLCAALLGCHAASAADPAMMSTPCRPAGRTCDAATLCCPGLICDRIPGSGSDGVCKKSTG